jgi:hypothetical protein
MLLIQCKQRVSGGKTELPQSCKLALFMPYGGGLQGVLIDNGSELRNEQQTLQKG